jgi:hypothetical protein
VVVANSLEMFTSTLIVFGFRAKTHSLPVKASLVNTRASEIYDFTGRALFFGFLFRIGLQIPAEYYVSVLTHDSKFTLKLTLSFHGRIGS